MRALAVAVVSLAAAAAAPGWHDFRAHGVSVRVPPGWFATARPLTFVDSPAQVLAVGSFRFSTDRGRADGCEPKEALDALPADGAFLYGWTYGNLLPGRHRSEFPPRPRHFRLTRFARTECMGPSYLLLFRDAGRFFQVHVAFGKHATAATRAKALAVLDSFRAR